MEAGRENSTKPSVGQFLQTVKPPDPISPPMQSCNLWSIILSLGGASKYVIYSSFYVSIVSINFCKKALSKINIKKIKFSDLLRIEPWRPIDGRCTAGRTDDSIFALISVCVGSFQVIQL